MVFRISKIHTNADFTFSNNKFFVALNISLDIKKAYRYNEPKYFSKVEW
jgi:hypothetical protein